MDTFTFDERDEAIRKQKLVHWTATPGPRVGDFVIMQDGRVSRFTHDCRTTIQTMWAGGPGSFYFSGWYCSYSGGLEPGVNKSQLVDTGELRDGLVWFFHHCESGAHRGVSCSIPCRVYRYLPAVTPANPT